MSARKPIDRPRPLPRGRHGLAPERVANHQRARMLGAVMTAVARNGYAHTSVADVLKEARVSRVTFYRQFGDREDCFLQAFDAAVEHLAREVEAAVERAGSWPQGLRAGIQAFLELACAHDAWAQAALCDIVAVGPAGRERYDRAVERFLPLLDEGRERSAAARGLQSSAPIALCGGVLATVRHYLATGQRDQLPGLLPDLVTLVLTPYLGARASARVARRAD
jgi:AcrR family transcriptional regulator